MPSLLVPVLWFMLSSLVTFSSSRTFCPRIFFQNINETTMPYKHIEGVYVKQNYDYNNFPVYKQENGNLLLYYTVNKHDVHMLVFGAALDLATGVLGVVSGAIEPTAWPDSGSLDRQDVFGGFIQYWMYYNARDVKYLVVPTSRDAPMIKAVCVQEDFRECNSGRVYLNMSFHDGMGNVQNNATQDYFWRKAGDFRNLRPIYRHSRYPWFLQYMGSYWVVTGRYDDAYMRVNDAALRPEYITKTWSAYDNGWRDVPELRVLCRGVTSTSNACPSQPCHAKATCVYTSGNETLCLCPSGYTGVRCSVNVNSCPIPSPIVGRELYFIYSKRRLPGDLGMSFCSGSYPSVRFSVCTDGNHSSYWIRKGMPCLKGQYPRTENPTGEAFTTEDIWNVDANTSSTPYSDHKKVNFDDIPKILPAVLSVAVLVQVLLPFVVLCCSLCKLACKEVEEEEEDLKRRQEISGELEKKLQRVAKAEDKEDQDQVIQDCKLTVEEYERETEHKEASRKRGLYRNASLCRLYSMQLNLSFYLWLIYLVSCDLTHCTQYGMILVHLRRFAIAMLVISVVIVLVESLYSHELDYLDNIMQDESAGDYIHKLQLIPPKINMTVECYHMETRSRVVYYTDGYGYLQQRVEYYQEKVVTFVDHDEFSFGSWVDVSKKELPVESWACLTRLKIDQFVTFGDQETKDDFERQAKEMILRNTPRDECWEFSWNKEIPKIDKRISAFVDIKMKPFWMRPKYFWFVTLLMMTWPYRWLFRAKTAKNYYELKKLMYKSATPPTEAGVFDAKIADLVNNASSTNKFSDAPESIQVDVSPREINSPGTAPYPPLNPVAGRSCAQYPAVVQLNAPPLSHGSAPGVVMPVMPPPIQLTDSRVPCHCASRAGDLSLYPTAPQPSAPPPADEEAPVRNTAIGGSNLQAPFSHLHTAETACSPCPIGLECLPHTDGPTGCQPHSAGPAYPVRPMAGAAILPANAPATHGER